VGGQRRSYVKEYLNVRSHQSIFRVQSGWVSDYILWSMISASGKKFQEGLVFRQIRPFGFGRNSQGLPWTRRAAKRREGEEMKFVFLLLLGSSTVTVLS
jgi:hypothetical protein